jgi:hypothetical protein
LAIILFSRSENFADASRFFGLIRAVDETSRIDRSGEPYFREGASAYFDRFGEQEVDDRVVIRRVAVSSIMAFWVGNSHKCQIHRQAVLFHWVIFAQSSETLKGR